MKINFISRCGAGLLLALVLASGLPAQGQSQAQQEKKQHSLSEKTSEALKKFSELQAQKPTPYDAMLALVESTLATVAAGSYDQAFLLDVKAKIILGMDKLSPAIAPWEEALKLHDQHQYFDEKYANDIRLYLAQLIFGDAIALKDPAQQQQQITRAAGHLKRHLDATSKPTSDTLMFYAQLLYQQAVADSNKINQDMLKQSRQVVERALTSSIQPKESFYVLYLAILQQENEVLRSADILELLTKKFPGKKDYWPSLMATYLNLAGQEKHPERQREYFIRAINSMERAQSFGFLKEPKDNFHLFTIYTTLGQISKASDFLHTGLKTGGIESTLQNWRYLGSYYQQANKEQQAIDALKEAAKLFPTEGMVDFQIGEIYRGLEKPKEARDYYRSALAKGKLEKPLVVWQLLAHTSVELEDWAEAQRAMNEAAKLPDFAKDTQVQSFKEYIDNTVRDREEMRKAKAEANQKK